MDNRKLVLKFSSETGKAENFIVNNVKADITLVEATPVANSIISENVFFTNTGDFSAFESAELVVTTTIPLE